MCDDAMEEEVDEMEEELSSQRELNESMVSEGDVDVQYAPMLPFLKVPDRKEALRKPFKLPGGAARTADPSIPRRTLGARRRPGGGIRPGFAAHTPKLAPVLELAPAAGEEEEEEEAAVELDTKSAADVIPPGYEPLVLYQPEEGDADKSRVEVEFVLGKFLREHQREGVQFMFDCVHGLKPYGGNGCILADDMGLGKTLQSITLLYTTLRQGIYNAPTAKRAIVVCPTSLVANWAKEIVKWVGDRIKVLALAEVSRDQAIMDINTFMMTRQYQVLIISYETFRIHAARFHARDDSCDLLICDEAHRLKNDRTLTTQALAGLACRRRVLLSGTPMQNDLDEFWAMVDFTNPGVLGDGTEFRRRFATPLLAAREPWASDRVKAAGDEASKELSNIVNQFILRRTNTLLSKHLPPKLMQVVCVRMSPLQRTLYDHILSSMELDAVMCGKTSGALASITALRKLVNHPKLVYDAVRSKREGGRRDDAAAGLADCEQFFPDNFHRERGSCVEMSGKFELMARMLSVLRNTTDDRIVIVSCYTQTLDIFSALCRENAWPHIRLDGSTSAGKRQKLVDKFNDPKNDEFVFLLSSKAGGCGLNLIGANRLVLFDPDWNPATDLQAAARVWRDGQRKKVYTYRFLATGTLEEKVFQRQLSKKGLQTIVVEEGEEMNSLSSDDLRNLFMCNQDTVSDTHDTMRCTRCRKPELEDGESDAELEAQAAQERPADAMAASMLGGKAGEGDGGGGSGAAATSGAGAVSGDPDDSDADATSAPRPRKQSRLDEDGAATALSTSAATTGGMPGDAGSSPASQGSACRGVGALRPDGGMAELEPGYSMSVVTSHSVATSRDTTVVLSTPDSSVAASADTTSAEAVVAMPADASACLEPCSPPPSGSASVASGGRSPGRARKAARAGAGAAAAPAPAGSDDEAADDPAIDLDADDEEEAPIPAASAKARGRGGKAKKEKGGANGGAGAAPGEKRGRKPTKAAERKAQKEAEQQRKAFEDAVAAAIKESLNKAMDPVAPGTVRRQLKWPLEDNLKNWSHHCGVDGVNDKVLLETGADLVSFVFGCEVQGRDLSDFAPIAAPAKAKGFHMRRTAPADATAAPPASAAVSSASAPVASSGSASTSAAAPTTPVRPVGGLGGLVRKRPGMGAGGGFKRPTPAGGAAAASPLPSTPNTAGLAALSIASPVAFNVAPAEDGVCGSQMSAASTDSKVSGSLLSLRAVGGGTAVPV